MFFIEVTNKTFYGVGVVCVCVISVFLRDPCACFGAGAFFNFLLLGRDSSTNNRGTISTMDSTIIFGDRLDFLCVTTRKVSLSYSRVNFLSPI